MKSAPQKNQFTTVMLFLCILAVRLIPAVYNYMTNYQGLFIAGDADALLYLRGAREILASGSNQFNFFPPLNFLLIAFFLYAGHGHVIVPMIAVAVVGWVTVIGVYLIAKDLFNKRTALIAALITGLYPNFIFYGLSFYAETLAIFFIVWAFFLLIRFFRSGTIAALVAAGVLWGLASLSRGGLNFFSLFIAGVISLNPVKAGNRFSIKPAAVFLLAMVLTVTIFSSVIPEQLGSTSLGSKSGIGSAIHGANRLIVCCPDYGNVRGIVFYLINERQEAWPAGSQLEMRDLIKLPSRQMYAELFKFIAEGPFIYIKNSLIKLSNFWSPNQYVINYIKVRCGPGNNPLADAGCFIIAVLYVGVVCGGLLGVASSRDPLRPLFFSFVVFYCLLIFVTVGNSKLRLPLMPFFIIYCAHVMASWGDHFRKRVLSQRWILLVMVVFWGNSIYKYQEIRLSPREVRVQAVELCSQLGFPKTALYLIEHNKKKFAYSAIDQERLSRAAAAAQKKLSEAPDAP